MKQYFKKIIKTIVSRLLSPICLPLTCLALVGLLAASCETTSSTRGKTAAKDLTMLLPLSEPAGHRLVPLTSAVPSIQIDLRYAKSSNITRKRLYDRSMLAMLDVPTAKKLAAAQSELRAQGYSLKVWDAYRPPEAHLRLWRISGQSGYVADPRWGWSKHCSGRAVDVTLTDAKTGQDVPMPSGFDDFSTKASSEYSGSNQQIAKNLTVLQTAMKNAGFIGIEMEWWHFENATRNQENLPPIYAEDAGVKLP